MKKNKIKGFSYNVLSDKDVIDHIDKQPNGSQYIWSLVRKDMNKEDIEVIVKREIENFFKNNEKNKDK